MAALSRRRQEEILKKIRWHFAKGWIEQTRHFKTELKEAGALLSEVRHLVKSEHLIVESQEFNFESGQWKYRIRGPDRRGEPLTVVLALDEREATAILITAF